MCHVTTQLQHIGAVPVEIKTENGQSYLMLLKDMQTKNYSYHAENVLDADSKKADNGLCDVWTNPKCTRITVL